MIKNLILLTSLSCGVASLSFAKEKEPEIRKEMRGKTEYMFINGIKVHESDPKKQPQPKVVEPKPYDAKAAKPPKGAKVLFDGTEKTLSNWTSGNGKPTKWKLIDGALESVRGGGYLQSTEQFGSCRLHVEFATPKVAKGNGQGRGNSGFYQVDHYEMQILDSFGLEGLNNECGGIYSKKASDVNGCFPPLSWQTYDVDFKNARSKDGKKTANAILTARLNGILIHNGYEIPGKTGGSRADPEGTPGPIKLQGHGNPLQFRNIWIMEK